MPGPSVVTAPLRQARDRLRRSLDAIADRVGALGALPAEERAAAMRAVGAELDALLRPHLDWEERTVHPVVDKFACEGPAAFSASMRYEHEIVFRTLDELRAIADDGAPAAAFSRRADNLLGIVLAHFELEEHVLFPILDRALGRAGGSISAPPQ